MPDASGHGRYPVDTASVLALAERLCAAAGNVAGDFVLAGIDARGGAIQHHSVPNGPDAADQIVALIARIGAEPYRNAYFAGSLFRSGAIVGNTGRTKKNVIGVLCAVAEFDAKNDPATRHARLPLAGSSELESSPGNFHVHYWFDRPYAGDDIEAALYALSDVTGADDCKSTEHLWRVPGTWNWPDAKKLAAGRSPQPFQAQWTLLPLELWEGTVTAEELCAAIKARDPSAFDRPHGSTSDPADFDWSRRRKPGEPAQKLTEEQITRALSKSGDRSKHGATFIRRCWKANYSPSEIVETMAAHGDAYVLGHYSGEAAIRADVQRIIGKPDPTERSAAEIFSPIIAASANEEPAKDCGNDGAALLRVIHVRGGALVENVNDGEAALIERGTGLFQRGELLVRPGEVVIEVRGRRKAKDLLLVPVKRPELIEHMTAAADFQRWDARKDDWKPVNCPPEIADAYLARVGRWKVRPLMGIVNAPTLRSDGTLLDQPGYDEATGLIYDPRGVTFPTIPAQPSRDDALAAVAILEELICGFPFATREARAVALAAILTICVRRTLPAAPLFGIDGTGPGTGKGLLADTIATVGSGRAASPVTAGANEEELEKRVASMLMRGDLAICIDNLNAPLESAFLCSALTQQSQAVRVLGQSKVVTTPTNSLFLATANGLSFAGDMWRRGLTCLIDPAMERPSERVFSFNPVERAKQDRGRYVAACLTIMRAYQAAGWPAQKGKPMGSFETWGRVVRDALLWLGEGDAAATCNPPADDPERERFAAVILGWRVIIGEGRGVTLKEAIRLAVEAACGQPPRPELLDAFGAVAPVPAARPGESKVNTARLAYWLRGKKRQVIHGFRLMPEGESQAGMRWRLERAGSTGGGHHDK
jgi:hypothetical protein